MSALLFLTLTLTLALALALALSPSPLSIAPTYISLSLSPPLSSSIQLFIVIYLCPRLRKTLIFDFPTTTDTHSTAYTVESRQPSHTSKKKKKRRESTTSTNNRQHDRPSPGTSSWIPTRSQKKIPPVMAATSAAVRESPPTEVRRRMSRVSTPGSGRDAAEERLPVNKKVKMSATSRGDDAGPLFVGESRGAVPAAVTMAKGKSTQTTAQQNVGYLGTLLFSAQLHIEPMVAEINIFYFKFDHRFASFVCQLPTSLLTSNSHSKRSLKPRNPPRNHLPAIRHRNSSQAPGTRPYRTGNRKNSNMYRAAPTLHFEAISIS